MAEEPRPIAAALGRAVVIWHSSGLKIDEVERFTRTAVWLDAYRVLDPEQRETILRVAMVMRRPVPRRRTG